jgi:hypothetical protein
MNVDETLTPKSALIQFVILVASVLIVHLFAFLAVFGFQLFRVTADLLINGNFATILIYNFIIVCEVATLQRADITLSQPDHE